MSALPELFSGAVMVWLLVLARCAAGFSLLPGFAGRMIPLRVKFTAAFAASIAVTPLVEHSIAVPETSAALAAAIAAESVNGLLLGIGVRVLVMALSFAGAVAANSMSLAQLAGPSPVPDQMTAMGTVLTLAGITLALNLGVHVHFVRALADSYSLMPGGSWPRAEGFVPWAMARGRLAFELGFTLAAPFVLAAFLYNLALGALNKAMPQLMVVLVGAPAISAASLGLLMLTAPIIAESWAMMVLQDVQGNLGALP